MENLNENNKLFGLEGVINRRNYIVNILLVETIVQALIATPLLVLVLGSEQLTDLILKSINIPTWFKITLCVSGLLTSIMYIPSVIRRIRDIFGESGSNKIKVFSIIILAILVSGAFSVLFKNVVLDICRITGLCVLIALAFIKGDVTGKLPADKIAKFNWGACIGTWIWGLFNKTYRTLWAIPLTFTLGFIPFCIVCGLKGNEWAYENQADLGIEEFHKKQKKHSLILLVAIPILAAVLVVGISTLLYNAMSRYAQNNPEFARKTMEYYVETQSKAAIATFDKIDFENGEYKFYMNPKKWVKSSNKERVMYFDMADSYIIFKALKEDTINNEINNIKIYSTFNNELLGELNSPTESYKKFVEEMKNGPEKYSKGLRELGNEYRFNEHPSLP